MNYSNTTNHIMWSLCLSSLWLYTATLCSLSTLTITPAAVVIYGKSQSTVGLLHTTQLWWKVTKYILHKYCT